jgi:hypothetical protein
MLKKTIEPTKALLSSATPFTYGGHTSKVIALITLHPRAPSPYPNIKEAMYLKGS